MTPPLLELDTVSKTFGPSSRVGGLFWRRRVAAVVGVSFTLPSDRAEIFTIVGQSGSGKTTLARMILGLEVPTSGCLRLLGEDIELITRLSPALGRFKADPGHLNRSSSIL